MEEFSGILAGFLLGGYDWQCLARVILSFLGDKPPGWELSMEVLVEQWGAVTRNCRARLLPWVLMGPSGSGHLGRSPGGSSPAALEPGQGTLSPVQTQFRMSPQAAFRSPSPRGVALAGCPRSSFSLTCFPHTPDGNLPKSGSSTGPCPLRARALSDILSSFLSLQNTAH